MKKDITNLFCFIDDFSNECKKEMDKRSISDGTSVNPTRVPGLYESEIITIIILFQQSPCKNFKFFYNSYLQLYRAEFPLMPSYERFVALMPRVVITLSVLLHTLLSKSSNISYIDSTSISVCHYKRISRNKVFKGIAALGKTTKGWFFGFKLHIIINEKGGLVKVSMSKGNKDDRSQVMIMSNNIKGLLFGDKGYISKSLFLALYKRGLKLVTGLKKGMKNCLLSLEEKIFLRKRSTLETVFDYLKNKLQLEHSRHRSPVNAFIHIIATLIAYQLKDKKPSITNTYHIANP
ncbi:IS982 family transposase [Candidatus Lariskella endosymbiont of Epinotia ramella]|uniref:IS982 family transposase n=1 Tax=Candidatus Lariskella endosymbiont of Epinotia ramella TaxID=3066224 RepID=UPI0030CC6501